MPEAAGVRAAEWAFSWSVARRFLTGDSSRVLTGTARSAVLSIAVGVFAMVIGMALMSGYRHDLENRLLAGSAAVGVFPSGLVEPGEVDAAVSRLEAIAGVSAVGRVVYGQGSLSSETFPEGLDVTLRGVDPGGRDLAGRVLEIEDEGDGIPWISPGSDLAARLGVEVGDTVRLTVLQASLSRPKFRYRSVRVRSSFVSGYFEFDRSWALVERPFLEDLTGLAGTLELTLEDPSQADRVALAAREILGPDFDVRNFRNANRDLFEALEWQQVLLFLVLGLIVVVSTFNVASTLMVLVRERLRQLGVLAALGASPRSLARVFVFYGALVGATGVLLGLAVGSGTAWLLDEFEIIRLGAGLSSIYFLSAVPFRLEALDLVSIGAFALIVTLAACLLPAWRASRFEPASALRYE